MPRSLKEVAYIHNLASDAIRRVRFVKQRGQVVEFLVQLECHIQEEWHVVVRYDTVHDFAHRDILRPDGSKEKTILPFATYDEALTFALFDLTANWRGYRDRYERWLAQ